MEKYVPLFEEFINRQTPDLNKVLNDAGMLDRFNVLIVNGEISHNAMGDLADDVVKALRGNPEYASWFEDDDDPDYRGWSSSEGVYSWMDKYCSDNGIRIVNP